MSAVVSYMEVYYSFFKIGKERFQSTLPYAQEYRSLIALEVGAPPPTHHHHHHPS
jgi:hypothetical protein